MCYARRQRSSWARIKLSKKLYPKAFLALKSFLRALICSLLKLLVSSIFFLNLKEFRVSVFCTLVLYFLISFIVHFSRIFYSPKAIFVRFGDPNRFLLSFALSLFPSIKPCFQGSVSYTALHSALLLYHLLLGLSSTFFKFFKLFFIFLFRPCFSRLFVAFFLRKLAYFSTFF